MRPDIPATGTPGAPAQDPGSVAMRSPGMMLEDDGRAVRAREDEVQKGRGRRGRLQGLVPGSSMDAYSVSSSQKLFLSSGCRQQGATRCAQGIRGKAPETRKHTYMRRIRGGCVKCKGQRDRQPVAPERVKCTIPSEIMHYVKGAAPKNESRKWHSVR